MDRRTLAILALSSVGLITVAAVAQPPPSELSARTHYLPALTINALNRGMPNFPEFQNVYVEPGSYEIYKKTNVFPEGTILFGQLLLTLAAENPDGSRAEPSGRGYFPGPVNVANAKKDEVWTQFYPLLDK